MKKTLRVFLLFAALLSWGVISQVQGAPFSGGDGSESSPFLIKTLDDLKYLSEHAEYWESGYCFKQTDDIDASDTKTWNEKDGVPQGFKPIGTNDQRFKGYYDGGNYAIRGLSINRPGQDFVGLFGVCENDKQDDVSLKDLRLEGVTVIGGYRVGGLAGAWYGTSKISNCHVTVQSVVGERLVGGLMGDINYSKGVWGCSATPEATESSVRGESTVGGFAGRFGDGASISRCFSSLRVVGIPGGDGWGGFAGVGDGAGWSGRVLIKDCYSLGSVETKGDMPESAGGFAGSVGYTKFFSCYSTGAVARVMADGTRAYSTSKGFLGQIMDTPSSEVVKNCYYQKDQGDATINNLSVTGVGVCEGLRCEDLQNGSLPEGFSSYLWCAERGVYPMVKTMPKSRVTHRVDGGNGTMKVEGGLASGTEVACGVPLRISLQPEHGYLVEGLKVNGVAVEVNDDAYLYITRRGQNDFEASFSRWRMLVTYAVEGEHGEIAIDGVGSGDYVATGTEVTITITPDANYEVDWLKCNGEPIAVTDNRAKWTVVDGKNEIVVKFKEMPRVFYREEGGHGSIKVEGVQSGDHVATGTKVTITLTPDANYEVESLECNGEPIAVEGNKAKWTVVDGKNEIVARFKELPVLAGSVEGGHGTIAFDGLRSGAHVNAGTDVAITLTPDANYEVESLECNGEPIAVDGNRAKWTVVDGKNEIVVKFRELPVVAGTVEGGHGTIAFDGLSSGAHVNAGTEVAITLTPDANYLVDWLKCGSTPIAVTDNRAKWTVVDGKNEIVVRFKELPVVAGTVDGGHGTIAFEGLSSGDHVNAGTEVAITLTPDAGYMVCWLKCNGKLVGVTGGKAVWTVEPGPNEIKVRFIERGKAQAPMEGTGEPNSPYEIATLANLTWLSETPAVWDKHFKQVVDIDASDTRNWNVSGGEAQGFKPIGTLDQPFKGYYDGGNHAIRGLYINRPGQNDVGLFGVCDNAVSLKDLRLEGVTVVGGNAVGGLAGVWYGYSKISNCHVTVQSVAGAQRVGGFIGIVNYYSGVSGCSATPVAAESSVRGLRYVGGFAGEFVYRVSISQCFSSLRVVGIPGGGSWGGFAGHVDGDNSTKASIEDCYSLGSVETEGDMPEAAGGFVGAVENAAISRCYSTGAVARVMADGKREYSSSKGFIGEASSSEVKNCYYQKDQGDETIINLSVTGVGVCEGLRCDDLQNGSLPGGFSADQWRAERGVYPMLKTMPVGRVTYRVDGGNGTVKVEGGLASGAEVACGVPLRISLQPQEGFMEDKLTANGALVELTTNAYTWITQRGANDFVANFLTKRTIVLYSVDGEHGEITVDGVGSGDEVTQGRKLEIALSPASGYEVDWLKCNGEPIAVDGNRAKWTAVDGRNRIVVKFREMPRVFYREEGGHGSIKVEGVQSGDHVSTGTEVTIALTPDVGYQVESLECNGKPIAVTDNRAKWTVAKGKNEIVAKFREMPVVLGTVDGGHGTIAFDGLSSGAHVNAGTEVAITLTPDAGYMVCWLKCNGKLVGVTGGNAVWTVEPGPNEIKVRFIERGKAQPPMEGTGEPNSPYEIATLANLAWLSETPAVWGKHFKQVADIDASDTRHWNVSGGEAQGFKPIGTGNQPFKGYYDGGNHAIRSLYINRPGQDYVGLFGRCENDNGGDISLKDLRLEGVTVVGGNRVGGLTGYWWGKAKILNCHVTVQSVAGAEMVGGFMGCIDYSNGVSGCSATPVAAESSVRGLRYVGGFVGVLGSLASISQCFSSLRVVGIPGGASWGGFAGQVYGVNSSNVSITDCYSLSSVETEGDMPEAAGGFVGAVKKAKISRCYSTGAVARVMADGTREYSSSKGFIGEISDWALENCYYQKDQGGETIINLSATGVGVCEGLRCEDLQNGSLPEGFSADQWHAEKGVYPMLNSMATAELTHRVEGGHGRIVVEGGVESGKKVSVGTPLRVKLVPDAGYEGKDLSANGQLLEKVREGYVWIMAQGENSLVASFQEPHADVFYSVAEGEGEIAIDGVSQSGASVKVGQTLTVTLRPHSGYRVLELTLNGAPVDVANDKATIITVAGKNEVVVKFKELPRVFYSVAEGVGSILIDGVQSGDYVSAGTKLTITLTLDANYEVESLECNGTPIAVDGNRAKWTVEDGKNEIVVKFKELSRVFYSVEEGRGSISIDGVQSGDYVATGTEVTITLTPAKNYMVWSLSCNGTLVSVKGNVATWRVVDGRNSIEARFKEGTFGFPESGDGSEGNPYLISTLENLAWISETPAVWGDYFRQTVDIDASDTRYWNVSGGEAQGFKPIGTEGQPFKGYYDGGNHAIRNLYINRPKQENVGLFGVCENDESYAVSLKNLWVEGVTVIGDGYVGGLAGAWLGTSKISNCHVTVQSVAGSEWVGGFMGYINYSKDVSGCSATPVAAESSVRGLRNVGGFASAFGRGASISQCFSSLRVVGIPRGAGWGCFVGAVYGDNSSNVSITDCYSLGSVETEGDMPKAVGGFVGSSQFARINQCYATGALVGKSGGKYSSNQGFEGKNDGTSAVGCYFQNEQGNGMVSVTSLLGAGMSRAALQSGSLPRSFSSSVWSAVAGAYPVLRCVQNAQLSYGIVGNDGGEVVVGGGIQSGVTLSHGIPLQIAVMPRIGYTARVTINGISVVLKDGKATWITVRGSNEIVVAFTKTVVTYLVAEGRGTIEVDGVENGQSVSVGMRLRIHLRPERGYSVAELTCNAVPIPVQNNEATWTVVKGRNDIRVKFRDDSTPVESELLSGVFAEPNPTEGVVRLHGAERVLRCAVYSVMGRLMQSYTLRGEGEAAIDLTQYPSGMYLLRLEDANGGVRTLRVMRR